MEEDGLLYTIVILVVLAVGTAVAIFCTKTTDSLERIADNTASIASSLNWIAANYDDEATVRGFKIIREGQGDDNSQEK